MCRFIPTYIKLRDTIERGVIGDVVFSEIDFGVKIDDRERVKKRELGGGSTLDLGVYAINFSQWVHGNKRPDKIVAAGHLFPEGTDSSMNGVMTYPGGGTAVYGCHARVETMSTARVYGTKGRISLPFPFWCASKIETPEGTFEFEPPKGKMGFNYLNSGFLVHEADHVRECVAKGLTESPILSLNDSLLLAEIMESSRKQVGVEYPEDK